MDILFIVAAVFIAFSALFATSLRFAADSRDGLRSPEQELARRGVRWAIDPAHDRALAGELAAARLRRHGRTAGPSTVSSAPAGAPRPIAVARRGAAAAA